MKNPREQQILITTRKSDDSARRTRRIQQSWMTLLVVLVLTLPLCAKVYNMTDTLLQISCLIALAGAILSSAAGLYYAYNPIRR